MTDTNNDDLVTRIDGLLDGMHVEWDALSPDAMRARPAPTPERPVLATDGTRDGPVMRFIPVVADPAAPTPNELAAGTDLGPYVSRVNLATVFDVPESLLENGSSRTYPDSLRGDVFWFLDKIGLTPILERALSSLLPLLDWITNWRQLAEVEYALKQFRKAHQHKAATADPTPGAAKTVTVQEPALPAVGTFQSVGFVKTHPRGPRSKHEENS